MKKEGHYAVEGRNLVKTFQQGNMNTTVLRNISIRVNHGDFVSIMGPSGSGKSTLLYLLSGLDIPSEGKIYINNQEISHMSDEKMSIFRRRCIGFVFQFYNLIPNLSVEENILLPLLLDGKNIKKYQNKLDETLDIVGLTDRKKHTPRELSGGQQQRVAVARSLIHNPDILFADEPTGNLDSKSGKEILNLLQRINQEQKKTILMVTHSDSAASYSNKKIVVRDGLIA